MKAEGEKLYPVLCAWCLREGKRTVLKMVDYPNSHGICPRHAAELVEQSRRIARALCEDIAQEAEPVNRRDGEPEMGRIGETELKDGEAANGVEAQQTL